MRKYGDDPVRFGQCLGDEPVRLVDFPAGASRRSVHLESDLLSAGPYTVAETC